MTTGALASALYLLTEEVFHIFVTAVGVLLFTAFVWKQMKVKKGRDETEQSHKQSFCQSPNCVRCQQCKSSNDSLINTLRERCYQYIVTKTNQIPSSDIDEIATTSYSRILNTIQSIERKSEIILSIYKESGYETDVSSAQILNHPHIWTVPDLKRNPFWSPPNIPIMQSISAFERVCDDYRRAEENIEGWVTNTTPTGKWKIFPLYNQGQRVTENCICCYETAQMIESISNFMAGCVFGNAMFSVLDCNSSIEPHTGPCNFRLRCHLPLKVPSGFKVQVGVEVKEWELGELLVFDDSFVHRVWHEGSLILTKGESEGTKGGNETHRVVLIFDIWHPDLDREEIDILSHCFSEPLS